MKKTIIDMIEVKTLSELNLKIENKKLNLSLLKSKIEFLKEEINKKQESILVNQLRIEKEINDFNLILKQRENFLNNLTKTYNINKEKPFSITESGIVEYKE